MLELALMTVSSIGFLLSWLSERHQRISAEWSVRMLMCEVARLRREKELTLPPPKTGIDR